MFLQQLQNMSLLELTILKNPSYEHNFPSYIRLSDTYITEDGASISELSEERVLCRWESVIIRL